MRHHLKWAVLVAAAAPWTQSCALKTKNSVSACACGCLCRDGDKYQLELYATQHPIYFLPCYVITFKSTHFQKRKYFLSTHKIWKKNVMLSFSLICFLRPFLAEKTLNLPSSCWFLLNIKFFIIWFYFSRLFVEMCLCRRPMCAHCFATERKINFKLRACRDESY